MHIEKQERTRTLSPAGGEGARAAAAALARVTEKTRQMNMDELAGSLSCASVIRRPSNTNDVESGIEVDLSPMSSTSLVSESRIAGHDPARLPLELFSKVLGFLDADSLLSAELVSQDWNAAANSDHVWRHIFASEFVFPAEEAISKRECTPAGGLGLGTKQCPQHWKNMWVARKQLNQRWKDGHAAAIYLEGHSDSVYCAQFDERKIVTGSRDWTVRIWDAKTYECTHVLGLVKEAAASHSPIASRKVQGRQPFVSQVPKPGTPERIVNDERHSGSILCMQYEIGRAHV